MSPAEAMARLVNAGEAARVARHRALVDGADVVRQQAQDWVGSADGTGNWPGLADATLDEKRRRAQLGRQSAEDTLMATGAYKMSFRVDASDPDRVVVASSDPVDVFHELGTARMPARPVLVPAAVQHGEAAARRVQDLVGAAIAKALAGG